MKPYEDCTHRTDQNDPTARPSRPDGLRGTNIQASRGDHRNDAELYYLIYGERTATKMFGHEFGDIGVNSY